MAENYIRTVGSSNPLLMKWTDDSWIPVEYLGDAPIVEPPMVVGMETMNCDYSTGAGSWTSPAPVMHGEAGDTVIVSGFGWQAGSLSVSAPDMTFTRIIYKTPVGNLWLERYFYVWMATLPDSTARHLTVSRTAGEAGGMTIFTLRGGPVTTTIDTALMFGSTTANNITLPSYNTQSNQTLAFSTVLIDASTGNPLPIDETTDEWDDSIAFRWDQTRNASWTGVQILNGTNVVPPATVTINGSRAMAHYRFALIW